MVLLNSLKSKLQSSYYRYALILLAFLAVGIGATFPLILNLNHSIFGVPGDSYGVIWAFWWNMNHPIEWAAPAQPTLLAAARIMGILLNEVTIYNLLILISYPLSGFAVYLIVHYFTKNEAASFLAGLIYILSPYHIYQSYVHLSLAMIAWLPFYFYALLLWLKDPRFWRAIISGFILALVILDNYYYGYFALLLTIFFVIGLLVQIYRGKLSFSKAISQGIVAIVITGLTTAPFIIPTLLGGNADNFDRPLRELFVFRAQLWNFFLPTITHSIFGGSVYRLTRPMLEGSNYFERTLFLGYIPLLLALFGAWRTRKEWLTYLLLALFLVSLTISTAPIWLATSLHEWFPAFRVYSRLGILSLMAVSILAGIGIASISKRTRSGLLYTAIGLLIAAEFYPLLPAPMIDVTTVAPYASALNARPTGQVAIYPMTTADELRTTEYLSDSRHFGQPLFNAISPDFHNERLYSKIINPNDPKAAKLLHELGVRYILIRKDIYSIGRIPKDIWRFYDEEYPKYMLPAFNGGVPPDLSTNSNYQLLYDDNQAQIYELVS